MNRIATREFSMVIALAAIWAFFAWQEPVFLSSRNLSLLSVELAHLVEDNRPFEAFTGHGLDVGPILGILLDVGVNFCVHLRIVPKVGLIGAGAGAGAAIGRRIRWCSIFAHNEVWSCFGGGNCRDAG